MSERMRRMLSLSALFSSLRSSEPSAVRPEGPPETNGMRRGKGVRKETTEVTEDEELTTLGILSAHFARRYHFICLGLTARSSLFPSHSSSTPLGSPPRSGRPSAGPEESGDGEGKRTPRGTTNESDDRWPLLVSVRHSSSPIVVSSLRPTREAAPPAGKECRETT